MCYGVYILVDFCDFPLGVDKERGAQCSFVIVSHEFLFAPDAVLFDHFLLAVRKQGERKLLFILEPFVAFYIINAHAEHAHF